MTTLFNPPWPSVWTAACFFWTHRYQFRPITARSSWTFRSTIISTWRACSRPGYGGTRLLRLGAVVLTKSIELYFLNKNCKKIISYLIILAKFKILTFPIFKCNFVTMTSGQILEYCEIVITIWAYYRDSIQIQSTCKDFGSITMILAEL